MDNMGLQFGVMNSLGRMSGDNPLLSILLCALVPILLSEAPRLIKEMWRILQQYFSTSSQYYTRSIVFTQGENMQMMPMHGSRDPLGSQESSTERNNILQKAIRLYINKDKSSLHIKDAELYLLTSGPDGASEPQFDRFGNFRQEAKYFGDMDAGVKKLMSYGVARGPRENDYLLVDAKRNIEFMFSTTCTAAPEEPGGKGWGKRGSAAPAVKTTTAFVLRSSGTEAEKNVDDFIEEALQFYKDQKAAQVDNSRYFFMPQMGSGGGDMDMGKGFGKGGPAAACTYKKYLLSDHKSFDCLFFPEKKKVLQTLDDFLNKTGKFAIPGFPNKLGLLLHGPPGTGKTSLIKSIAQYTNRHIVDVPLTKVKTNQDLFDNMFDLCFAVPGEDEAIRMKFENVLFVMEDVDAASKVVYRRATQKKKKDNSEKAEEGKSGKGKGKELLAELERKKAPGLQRAQSQTLSLVRTITIGSEDKPPERSEQKSESKGAEEEQESEEEEEAEKSEDDRLENLAAAFSKLGVGGNDADGKIASISSKSSKGDDQLNLSGVLNVLDGVVDSPGRILIMTTNHPEKLDPALIRPGRINFAIELGYMKGQPLCELISRLMASELTKDQIQKAHAVASRLQVTPAQVEQSCAEVSTVDALLMALEQIAEGTSSAIPKRW